MSLQVRSVIVREEALIEVLDFLVRASGSFELLPKIGNGIGHSTLIVPPAAEHFLGKFVTVKAFAQNQAGLADDQFE